MLSRRRTAFAKIIFKQKGKLRMKRLAALGIVLFLLAGCATPAASDETVSIPLPGSGVSPAEAPSLSTATAEAPADIVINEELVGLVGGTNGTLKQLNGTAATSSLISGGIPHVDYTGQNAPYPLGFRMDDMPWEDAQADFAAYEGPRDPLPLENVFPDDYVVVAVGMMSSNPEYAGSFPEVYTDIPNQLVYLFTYEGELTQERLTDFFGQEGVREDPPENYIEFVGPENAQFYVVEYPHSERYITVEYNLSGTAYGATVSLHSNQGNQYVLYH